MAASLNDSLEAIEKARDNVKKADKDWAKDGTKKSTMKEVDDLIKEADPLAKEFDSLQKRIKDAKKLADDVDKFIDKKSKLIKSAVAVAKDVNSLSDTKSRDYFKLATALGNIGQNTLDDLPGKS